MVTAEQTLENTGLYEGMGRPVDDRKFQSTVTQKGLGDWAHQNNWRLVYVDAGHQNYVFLLPDGTLKEVNFIGEGELLCIRPVKSIEMRILRNESGFLGTWIKRIRR